MLDHAHRISVQTGDALFLPSGRLHSIGAGNLFVCGPGGIWVLSPGGDRLGLLELPEAPHNLAWGDGDLYITAMTSIYRLRPRSHT